jgi:hypothetical protein
VYEYDCTRILAADQGARRSCHAIRLMCNVQ